VKKIRPYVIAVDFDGTLCEDLWPKIGMPKTEAIHYILNKQHNGCKIILWTCRTGELLDNAIEWCRWHGLTFDAVNENLPELIELYGGDTRKISADEYIDDKNIILKKEAV
jgi:hypothetical protein